MKKNFGIVLAIALGLSALLLTVAFQAGWVKAGPFIQEDRAGAPTIVSYQGSIEDGSGPYNGLGFFKFALVNSTGTITYWSNNGTSSAGSEPNNWIEVPVVNGYFSVNLGDTTTYGVGMSQALSASVFNSPDTYLRIWFSPEDTEFYHLTPDQKIASVPYALQAQQANQAYYASEAELALNSELFDGFSADWFQKRVTDTCEVGKAVTAVNSDGSVVCGPSLILSPIDKSGNITNWAFSSMVIGRDGMGLISYYDYTLTNLMVAHCSDFACSEATLSTIDGDKEDVGWFSDIVIGSDGLGIISYYDQTNMNLKVAHCIDTSCTSAAVVEVDTGGDVGLYSSIAIGTDGLPLISYFDASNLDLKVAHCSNITCTTPPTITTLDSTNNTGQYTSIAIGGDGLGLISYMYSTGGDLKVAHCNNINCTAATYSLIDPSYANGVITSVTIGTDGLGLISYGGGLEPLKVAHCKDALCSSSSSTLLDGSTPGDYSSIAIGMDGMGLISYFDVLHHDLKVAHCSNLVCSSAFTYTLDGPDQVGAFTSIAIGSDGLGLISYIDFDHGALKVAHCSNRFCNPDW